MEDTAIKIKIVCPSCKSALLAAEDKFGKKARCPKCGEMLVIPQIYPDGDETGEAVDELVGKDIAHYRIESFLGEGGMARVYKATNNRLMKTCALKVLSPDLARKNPSLVERFLREARLAAKLQHPNVLPVWFVGEEKGYYFIEMLYASRGTLEDLLEKRGSLPLDEAVDIISQVAAGLSAAHEEGIVHRDVKPSNVLLTKSGMFQVADFGLARMSDAESSLTLDGQMVGTPLYMSPEQAEGKPTDHRCDIYSLGVMFYRMLTGYPPFTADSPAALVHQHVYSPMPPLKGDAPAEVERLISKMMEKNPGDRFQSCEEVISALDALPPLAVKPAAPRAAAPPPAQASVGVKATSSGGGAARPLGRIGFGSDDPDSSDDDADVDLTPMIDVTFLLLIFFMVTATYITQQTIELPKTRPNPDVPEQTQTISGMREKGEIVIDVKADGTVLLDRKEISVGALRGEIANRVSEMGKSSVIVNPDPNARHEAVVRVIDVARLAGVEEIIVAIVKPQTAAAP